MTGVMDREVVKGVVLYGDPPSCGNVEAYERASPGIIKCILLI